MKNVEKVHAVYEAFGRGDVPAILELLADDVEWEYGTAGSEVPWLKRRHGRADVADFFQSLTELEFHKFVPTTFLEGTDVVVALVDLEATVKRTGQKISEQDEAHIWRFDARGRVSRFRHGVDTHRHFEAFRG